MMWEADLQGARSIKLQYTPKVSQLLQCGKFKHFSIQLISKRKEKNIYYILGTQGAWKSLGSTTVQGKCVPPPTLYLDSKIERRTPPGLEIIHIILKHILQKEFTIAIHLWNSCSVLLLKKEVNFCSLHNKELTGLSGTCNCLRCDNIWLFQNALVSSFIHDALHALAL